ncbi:MAG: polyprenyl synthetase family protein [Gammaproteobacteria bacterium]|jgi:geranylgeranyl pyrophosphate synthase|nr:polyprenyl synthetase family protein [Gammaproteobacteria bacterium]
MSKINIELQRLVSTLSAPCVLKDAMLWALLGGKLYRGQLTYVACLAWGATDQQALRLACAVEAAHACSLVHDDLPAMDNDQFRRGQLTVHAKFGEAIGILVGDALISLAYEWIASTDHPNVASMIRALGYAFGPEGMIGGQYVDLHVKINSLDELFELHAAKTGRLFGLCLALGMLCKQSHVEGDIWEIGRLMGIAYQCIDDFQDQGIKDAKETAPHFLSQDAFCQLIAQTEAQVDVYLKAHCPEPFLLMPQIKKIFAHELPA